MADIRKREFILGIVMLVAGAAYLGATTFIPRKQFIDASFVPYVLGIMVCIIGALQLRAAAKLPATAKSEVPIAQVDYATVWKTVGLIVVYAALLSVVGFPIMTVLYLFAQFIMLTPVDRKPGYVLYGVIAVVTSASVYLLFRYAFDLMLPLGLLDLI